jgi:Ser/Thr protein kinase RdoA (MazF antagonist)
MIDLPAELADVLLRFPAIADACAERRLSCESPGAGFSGARVWKVGRSGEAPLCLRRWPPAAMPRARLSELHRWLSHLHQGGVPVAVPLRTATGESLVESGGVLWQLEPWLPGEPHSDAAIPAARVESALRCLALLHRRSAAYAATDEGRVWFACGRGPSPAVSERLSLLADWGRDRQQQVRESLQRRSAAMPAALALEILKRGAPLLPRIQRELQGVAHVEVPLHPCLRDVWRDHILFQGRAVSGMIDPSAARTECVACDLTRWLGSVLPDDAPHWAAALDYYAGVRALTEGELRLLPALDRSSVLLSGLHWSARLAESRWDDPEGRLTRRLERILARLLAWPE